MSCSFLLYRINNCYRINDANGLFFVANGTKCAIHDAGKQDSFICVLLLLAQIEITLESVYP